MSRAWTAFPWRAAMAFGLGTLRLPPSEFWRMTPRELAALCGASSVSPPPRDELDALLRRFPDDERTDHAPTA